MAAHHLEEAAASVAEVDLAALAEAADLVPVEVVQAVVGSAKPSAWN